MKLTKDQRHWEIAKKVKKVFISLGNDCQRWGGQKKIWYRLSIATKDQNHWEIVKMYFIHFKSVLQFVRENLRVHLFSDKPQKWSMESLNPRKSNQKSKTLGTRYMTLLLSLQFWNVEHHDLSKAKTRHPNFLVYFDVLHENTLHFDDFHSPLKWKINSNFLCHKCWNTIQ